MIIAGQTVFAADFQLNFFFITIRLDISLVFSFLSPQSEDSPRHTIGDIWSMSDFVIDFAWNSLSFGLHFRGVLLAAYSPRADFAWKFEHLFPDSVLSEFFLICKVSRCAAAD